MKRRKFKYALAFVLALGFAVHALGSMEINPSDIQISQAGSPVTYTFYNYTFEAVIIEIEGQARFTIQARGSSVYRVPHNYRGNINLFATQNNWRIGISRQGDNFYINYL